MQTTQPLFKFTIAGGTSPSTGIRADFYENGDVIVLIENGWPIIDSTNEVGIYKYTITQEELQEFIRSLENIKGLNTIYGEKIPGSLRYQLTILNDTNTKIQWDHFAKIPEILNHLKKLVLQLIKNSLQYNYQTIKVSFEISSSKIQDNAIISLHNTGKVPVTIIIPENAILKKRMFLIAHRDYNDSSYLDFPTIYSEATPFYFETTKNTFTIAADKSITFKNTITLQQHKDWYAIMELHWTNTVIVNKDIYSSLLTKAILK